MNESEIVTRRKFIGTSALAGAAATFPYVARGEDLKSDTIRVAAIGLGGRGTGAIGQILDAPKDLAKKGVRCNTKLVAVAEAFLPSSSANELQPQTSLGNSLVRAITGGVSDSNEHFVATPLCFEAVDSRVAPTIATRV